MAALLIILAIKHAENQVPEGLHQYNTPQETAAFQQYSNLTWLNGLNRTIEPFGVWVNMGGLGQCVCVCVVGGGGGGRRVAGVKRGVALLMTCYGRTDWRFGLLLRGGPREVAILCDMRSLMPVGFFFFMYLSMNHFLPGCLFAVVVI